LPITWLILLCVLQLCTTDAVRESNRRGAERFSHLDFVGAVRMFEDALRHDPKCGLVRTNLVVACLHAGRLEDARRHIEYLSSLGGDDPHTHYLSGVLLLRWGRAEEAAAHFESVLRRDGRDAATLAQLGMARLHAGLYPDAVDLLRRAVDLDPSDHTALYNLSRALLMLGRRDEATPVLEEFRRLKKNRPDAALGGMGDPALIPGRYARIRCLEDSAER
jgi:Flp pilus assembly protein TadD